MLVHGSYAGSKQRPVLIFLGNNTPKAEPVEHLFQGALGQLPNQSMELAPPPPSFDRCNFPAWAGILGTLRGRGDGLSVLLSLTPSSKSKSSVLRGVGMYLCTPVLVRILKGAHPRSQLAAAFFFVFPDV